MKNTLHNFFRTFGLTVKKFHPTDMEKRLAYQRLFPIFKKFQEYTMIPEYHYIDNLLLAEKIKNIPGNIVECGVWKGGMIASMAEILGNSRTYYLFDSFEGLPDASEIDGKDAINWQKNKEAPHYYDNCAATIESAKEAMILSGAKQFELIKGWFENTLPGFKTGPIALLRLDGDWYSSTMVCLGNLYESVVDGGIIIIDDYHFWDGCTLAVHEFLSSKKLPQRIRTTENGVAYIIKNETINRFPVS